MPQAIFVQIGLALANGVGQFLIVNSALLSSGALLLGSLALSARQRAKAKRQARDAFNAAQVDRLTNVVTTVAPRELVMGRVRKGGTVFFKGSTGANKSTYVLCIAIAAHEIDGVEQIYFNDEPVTLDGSGNVTSAPYAIGSNTSATAYCDASGNATLAGVPVAGTVAAFTGTIAGREGDLLQQAFTVAGNVVTSVPFARTTYQYVAYSYRANVRWHLGSDSQSADATLAALFPSLWTSAHRARGVAYLICRFEYDETAFPTGVPTVTATIRGAKLYDPRSGLTAWSENPALMMRHVYTHPAFGKGTATAAEDARIATAANACDASHGYVVGGVTDTQPLYRAGLVQPYGAAPKDVLDDLAQAMAGAWAWAGGELYLKAGSWTGSVLSLTDDDLAVVVNTGAQVSQSPVAISVHRELQQKFNTVTAQIWDAAQDYKQVTLTPLKSAALIFRDGVELVQSVSLPAVGYAPQALHICGVLMRDARDPLTVTIPFKLKAYPVQLFDVVALTIARYGWSGKLFQVLGREWSANGALQLTLKETAEAIYTPDAAFSAQGYAANTALPSPWFVPVVGPLVVASGTSELVKLSDGTIITRMRVSWPALDDFSVTEGGVIEVQYRSVLSDGEWQREEVAGSNTQAVITGVQDANAYTIRARARSRLAVGQWSDQVVHTVLGKTEPPPDVQTFYQDGDRLSWGAVTALDLAGYEIRFNYGINTWWPTAARLHAGQLTDSPYTMSQRPAGLVTLLIKAVDTSGNPSADAAIIVANLGDIVADNLLLEWPQAPTFADGVMEGAHVDAGVLVADDLDRFFESADEPMFRPDTDDWYPASSYSDMRYTWTATPSSPGTLLLAHSVSASQYAIEVRRASQDAMFTPGADLMFGGTGYFFGPPGEWTVWPGSLQIDAAENIEFRISAAGGAQQGQISLATAQLDVPDVVEQFNDLVIAPAGTRLPITQSYRDIVNVQITVQADGNGGLTARTEDKDHALGPLVRVFDVSGSPVDGLIDATVQGY